MRILMADDNAINRKVTESLFQELGYRVDSARNGLEALEAVRRTRYDAIFLDVRMPEMDGLTAARTIVQEFPSDRPRLIALTASASVEDRQECFAAGMDDFLSKPIELSALQEAILRCAPVNGHNSKN